RAWADEYHTALIADRNLMMADRLDAMMRHEEPHTYFVTIGLLHVALPEDSIIRHLESRGYQVERCGQP
ncbi:MAG: TraB/GumN family protein, partial [Clostridia bacterium]|nr:TraB/GumN family protein [Clostridia bacterium]